MPMPLRPPSPLISVTVASSRSAMQSHSTLPPGVHTRSARWPMAKLGCVPMPIRPGSCWRKELKCRAARLGSVVQLCPVGGTYCRSSSQIGQALGGCSLGGYCVPQAVQMKAGMGGDSSGGGKNDIVARDLCNHHARFVAVGFMPGIAQAMGYHHQPQKFLAS